MAFAFELGSHTTAVNLSTKYDPKIEKGELTCKKSTKAFDTHNMQAAFHRVKLIG